LARPLVIAHHLVWTAYGWWLPNDPRGSTSREVREPAVGRLGEHHFGRRAVQPPPEAVRQFYASVPEVLSHPLLELVARDAIVVAEAFAEAVAARRYTCYACAILPDHVHLVLRKHRDKAEQMIEALQEASRLRLSGTGRRPTDHPVWTRGGWKGFLDSPDAVRAAIRYVERNPAVCGLAPQRWKFVKPYNGWPLHPGHNPQSPYAKRLRQAGGRR